MANVEKAKTLAAAPQQDANKFGLFLETIEPS
jgi:hypothetical protein